MNQEPCLEPTPARSRRWITRRAWLWIAAAVVVAGIAVTFVSLRDGPRRDGALRDDSGTPYTAEQLFTQMEGRLAKARTVSCTYRVDVQGQSAPGLESSEGSFTLAEWNRLRLDARWPTQGETVGVFVSDGIRFRARLSNSRIDRPTKRWLNREFIEVFSHLGVFAWVAIDDHVGHDYRAGRFTMGSREEVSGRQTQVVEYSIGTFVEVGKGEQFEPAIADKGAVWLDVKTGLPVKRVVTRMEGMPKDLVVTETYLEWKLDGTVRPEVFNLPE